MSRYGWSDISIQVDATEGGAPQEMKAYVLTFNGLDVEAILEDMTVAGSSWEASEYVGLKKGSPVTLTGPYDDTASTGSDATFNAPGETRSCIITWGGSKTSSFEAIFSKYRRAPAKGQQTKYEVTMVPTSTITEV